MKTDFPKVFFCTGARNHELLKILDRNEIKFEFDERMASFKALGLAKALGKPVAVCTTSGTAVSQCVSAMLEAYYSETPLVLISGDRPKKLHGTGSPQTIEHEALTRSCRRTYIEIDVSELPDLELGTVEYPVHVNVLVDDTTPHFMKLVLHEAMGGFAQFLKDKKRPLFLISQEAQTMRPFVEKLLGTSVMFYAETLSGAHELSTIKTEKKLVELFEQGFFDSIVRIGHTPLSKIWRLLEKRPLPVFHFDSRKLPGLSFGELLTLSSKELLQRDDFWGIIGKFHPYAVTDETLLKLEELIKRFPLSEVSKIAAIQERLQENGIVYLGNSLVVRFFELTHRKSFRVFGNRGVNGIDGQLATAIGLALGTSEMVTCILGDVTALYDLSSLREVPQNLQLIIINNRGGRIFDMLKLDKRIVMEHEHDFEQLALAMQRTYSKHIEDFGKVQVLELFPDREETENFLKEWSK